MQRSMEMFACSGLSELGPLLLLSSMSRFRHIEALMLCAEMAWAVREAHHEVVHNVLHGEIVDSQDENILQVNSSNRPPLRNGCPQRSFRNGCAQPAAC